VLRLVRTPLPDATHAAALVALCRHEPDLHASSVRIAGNILREREGRLLLHDGVLVGAVFLYPRGVGWHEIGTFIVHHSYRAHGLGRRLIVALTAGRTRLLTTTRAPDIERMLARLGFRRARVLKLPQPIVASMLFNRTYRGIELLKRRPSHMGLQLLWAREYRLWVRD